MNPIAFMKYLKAIAKKDKGIVVDDKEASLLLNGEKIPVTTEKYSTMTVELLKSFVDEKKYYKQFFNDLIEKDNSKFSFIIEDELGRKEYFDYKKLDIISAFEWAKDNDKLKNEEIEKFKLLKMSSELSAFLDKYKGEKRSINIDGKFVTLPVISFINLLSMEEEEIAKVISKEEFNDLSLNEFVFALDNFLDETKILERFNLPNTYLNNLSKLKEIVDITYINRCIDNDNTYLKKVQVSENFKQELLSDILSHFDKLEKAYYIYYRMCYLLTYDGEQFARRENKDYEIAHHDFDRIKTIDSRNNKIVCYEFNAIYANMLRELGINYELNGDRMYSLGHASLTFRVDNYLVNADSTVGLIKSDLSYAKNGMKLLGFTLESENSKTKEEFYRKIETVNKFIKMQNDKKYFGTVRELNKFAYSIPSDLDLETKTALFITMSNNSNLPIVDKIPYQIELKNKLFPKNANTKKVFNINYLSKKEMVFRNEKYSPICLITLNENGVEEDFINNTYIELNSNNTITYNINEVKYRFENNDYAYTKGNNRFVPGIGYIAHKDGSSQDSYRIGEFFEKDANKEMFSSMFNETSNENNYSSYIKDNVTESKEERRKRI